MEFFLALFGLAFVVTAVFVPWIALSKANRAQRELDRLRDEVAILLRRLNSAGVPPTTEDEGWRRRPSRDLSPSPEPAQQGAYADTYAPKKSATAPPPSETAPEPRDVFAQAATQSKIAPVAPEPEQKASVAASTLEEARSFESHVPPESPPAREPPPPRPPPEPSAFELQMREWIGAAKEWLFGGNLVAKVGLLILFVGVAFLVRLASNYVTVPIELRLAGVAAGAIALLVWGWRIRESRRGIALPAQGAALAILMLVTFGAFKLFHVLPGGATFAMLFVLIAFTCLLAVLQDALWLAIFGIAGGFAAPILTSTGGGSHVALFSYYSLLNAGILFIALKRSWRVLNVLGFAFTFLVGAAWGEQRYVPENYLSSQLFLIVFWLFYIAIAIVYAWRRAPELKSYVDGTLVFGVPMAGMALQYGLVKDIHFGMAISSLVVALTYAVSASVLWRWRSGTLRLLVESFLALAIVFGTLAIPLAFDGRWTSAAWAVEGAAIVWIGLKQKQKLAWQFGVAVQLGSWIAFVSSLAGLDPLATLKGNVGLGFLVLGTTGVLLALMFRRHVHASETLNLEQRARRAFIWMANGFVCVAVLWLLLGLWVETWLRLTGAHRASVLVATALILVYALQFLGKKSEWRLPEKLGAIVASIAGVAFAALIFKHMDWRNIPAYEITFGELFASGPLMGGLMLCGGALVSAFAFKNRPSTEDDATRTTTLWLLAAMFWWCGFVLNGLGHAIEFLTAPNKIGDASPWYAISFWSAYSLGLALSAWAWVVFARHKDFPNPRRMVLVLWPALSVVAGWLYWKQVAPQIRWHTGWLTQSAGTMSDAFINLIAGPLFGALLLAVIAWRALRTVEHDDALDTNDKKIGLAVWTVGLGIAWYALSLDALALFVERVFHSPSDSADPRWWQFNYGECLLLLVTLSAMAFARRAQTSGPLALRWLAIPAAVLQALTGAALLLLLYLQGKLPSIPESIALLGCWLGVAWLLRFWTHHAWPLPNFCLRALHFGRVIAPWLAIAPVVSLSVERWFNDGATTTESGWIVAGMWPDYLAAWVGIGSVFVLLRQAKTAGWPLAPLHEWYLRLLLPLATFWSVLLVVYWNLRQNGSMAPLPYLPILNPLDVTTGFAALLAISVWRANDAHIAPEWRRFGIKAALGLSFGWLNLMLLRTAAQYLDIPYRFHALYASQFVQAMLSLVWTLTALLLMRYAVRALSKPLWMVGAALLAIVVAKLIFIDLSNAGSIARIVSFIGVGGLLVVIGYLAPFPRKHDDASTTSQEQT